MCDKYDTPLPRGVCEVLTLGAIREGRRGVALGVHAEAWSRDPSWQAYVRHKAG